MYDKLKKSHKPYAKKIMCELYPDKYLDVDSICSKFVKKRHAIVRASIKDLEKCGLLKRVDSADSKNQEKLYQLSNEGKSLLDTEMSIISRCECED